jgi:hypothetical protein
LQWDVPIALRISRPAWRDNNTNTRRGRHLLEFASWLFRRTLLLRLLLSGSYDYCLLTSDFCE